MKDYLQHLNKMPSHPVVLEMKEYAQQNKIAIIQEEGMAFINQLVRLTKPNTILEIGTAIGYSAINMALSYERAFIDTIERNEEILKVAKKNIEDIGLQERINLLVGDALEVELSLLRPQYDLIFIDAAKSQYKNFFNRYEKLLKPGGIIIVDNLLFYGLVIQKEKIESKNLRNLVQKIRDFNRFLADNPSYQTTFYNIGDGIAVSIKVK